MIISVRDETGELFSYSTEKDSMCLCPGLEGKPPVIAALQEAVEFLTGSPKLVQGSPRVGGVAK